MIIKELVNLTFENIIIYKSSGDYFIDLYKGCKERIPKDLLSMQIVNIGIKRKGWMDIRIISN